MINQKTNKKIETLIKKTLAVILAGVFLFTNTLSWAKEEKLFSAGTENIALSSHPADNTKLAPPSKLDSEDFKYSLTVGAICKHVEHDGNLDDKSYLNDVLARLDAEKNHNITVLPHEIMIEIPNEGLVVRYFDPTKVNVITPYSDISKLSTKVIGPRLNRQIIHRIEALSLIQENIPQGKRGNKSNIAKSKFEQMIDIIKNLKEPRNHPKSILIVLKEPGTSWGDLGWGDIIINYRIMVASLLKTWPMSIKEIVIVSNYPEVFSGMADSRIKNVNFSDVFNSIDRHEFDLIIDASSPNSKEGFYLSKMCQVFTSRHIIDYDYFLGLLVMSRSAGGTIQGFLSDLGLTVPERSDYTLRRKEDRKSNTIFVNFFATTYKDLSQQLRQQWVQTIALLLNSGYDVVVNGGASNDTESNYYAEGVVEEAKKMVPSAASIQIKQFKNRSVLVNYLNNVRYVVTIDTGVFWAAQEIVGIPSVVITGDRSYISSRDEDGFYIIDHIQFSKSPNLVIKKLKELEAMPKVTSQAPFKNGVFSVSKYIDRNEKLFKDTLGENKPDALVRVPVEAIESVGVDNIRDFFATFQKAPNGYIELYYMSGIGETSESVYQKYGLQKKSLPKDFKRTRENTVTLFPALKGEEINQSTIVSRLGNISVTPENTIISPIGLQYDTAGLIRATVLGLKIMDIARQVKEGKLIDKNAVHVDILNQLRDVLDPSDFKNFDLTPDDIIALATGNINNILTALKKLIKLLPITPINAEELRQIYEHVKAVITAA